MNINLIQARHDGVPVMAELDDNKATLERAGYAVVGGPVLLPADQKEYPGAFQAWWVVWRDETGDHIFMWINEEGEPEHLDTLPESHTFDPAIEDDFQSEGEVPF